MISSRKVSCSPLVIILLRENIVDNCCNQSSSNSPKPSNSILSMWKLGSIHVDYYLSFLSVIRHIASTNSKRLLPLRYLACLIQFIHLEIHLNFIAFSKGSPLLESSVSSDFSYILNRVTRYYTPEHRGPRLARPTLLHKCSVSPDRNNDL